MTDHPVGGIQCRRLPLPRAFFLAFPQVLMAVSALALSPRAAPALSFRPSAPWLLPHLDQPSPCYRRAPCIDDSDQAKGHRKSCTVVLALGNAHNEHMTLAGRIRPVAQKLLITPAKAKNIIDAVVHATEWTELTLLALLGWGLVPLAEIIRYNAALYFREMRWLKSDENENDEKYEKEVAADGRNFQKTKTFQVVDHISQASKIGFFVYMFDMFTVILDAMGFKYKNQVISSKQVATISYAVWTAQRLKIFKRYLIGRAFHRRPERLGRAKVYDRIANALLFVATFGLCVDLLDLDLGYTLSSLLTFGGVGTLVFSLASKDLASELVSGLALTASGSFFEGDEIKLGDGTTGIINKVGWIHTEVRGFDEIVTKIPNSQIATQRASNVSKIQRCQVKQTLWFSHSDMAKMPEIITAIKEEIKAACPKLITDGSRPFRVHWRDIKEDHLEVVVDCHFNLPPTGNVYWDNREVVLKAISRAVQKMGTEFAIPSYVCKNE